MDAGAAVSTGTLIISLALISAIKAALRTATPGLTAAQVSDVNTLITLAMVFGLAVIGLWLWMARANGQGRNWARILPTVLFGLATLEMITARPQYPGGYLTHLAVGGRVLGDPNVRPDSARPDRPRTALADRPGRGVAALAPRPPARFSSETDRGVEGDGELDDRRRQSRASGTAVIFCSRRSGTSAPAPRTTYAARPSNAVVTAWTGRARKTG
jgi:hypothetical protein